MLVIFSLRLFSYLELEAKCDCRLFRALWMKAELPFDGASSRFTAAQRNGLQRWLTWLLRWMTVTTCMRSFSLPLFLCPCIVTKQGSTGVFSQPDLFVWFRAEMEEEASRPEKDCKTLSSDLIEYVQYMIREHKDDYKVNIYILFTQRGWKRRSCFWKAVLGHIEFLSYSLSQLLTSAQSWMYFGLFLLRMMNSWSFNKKLHFLSG